MRIPLSSPSITDTERNAVLSVLNTTTLSIGPRLTDFEASLCKLTGASHAIAVNSGTSGLHLAIKAAGIGPGDEVITTPFSFVASANCALFEGAKPIFVDIDEQSYNLDVNFLSSALTPNTRAILPVHVFGRPCRMQTIRAFAVKHDLFVIEDACESIGAHVDGRHVGTFGDLGVFAFYPNKQITTGEGGAIVTNSELMARRCRSWRNQGRAEGSAWLSHEDLGFNYRLSEMNCALGTAQLQRLPEILGKRAAVASLYSEILRELVPQVILPAEAERGTETSWFVYVVRLSPEFSRSDRDAILDGLQAAGIGCNNYFSPIHLQPYYRERFGYTAGDFPVAERVAERTIALPFFTDMRTEQVEHVCSTLHDVIMRVSLKLHTFAHSAL